MAYVPVPKDLNAVKTKAMFNLTKRQLICFSIGGLFGLPVFFLLKDSVSPTVSTLALIAVCFPFFMLAMFEKYGQPLEVILKQMYMVKFGTPAKRPYKSQNLYELLEKQYNLNKEVQDVVKKTRKTNTKTKNKGKTVGKIRT